MPKLTHSDATRLAIYAERAGFVLSPAESPDGSPSSVYGTWQLSWEDIDEPRMELWLNDFTTSDIAWWERDDNTEVTHPAQRLEIESSDPSSIATALLMIKCLEADRGQS